MQNLIKTMADNPDKAYDYISNHGRELSKYELIDVCKELLYAIHSKTRIIHDSILKSAAEELQDRYSDEVV